MNTKVHQVKLNKFSLQLKEIKPDKPSDKFIFFLHDSLGCITLWRDFPEKIVHMTGFNAIIYDRYGYGLSTPYPDEAVRHINYMEDEADILAQLATQLDIKSYSIFGHSDGGTIALITAAKYPKQVDKLMVVGPHIYVEDITRKGVKETKAAYFETDLKQRLEKYHGIRVANLMKIWWTIWLSDFFGKWNLTDQLRSITCPLLCIQGEKDEFGTMQQVWDIQKNVSGTCNVVEIPDAGHTPHKEDPPVVLALVESFLGS